MNNVDLSRSPIKERVAPSYPFTVEITDGDGTKQTRNFRLCFDFNSLARIEKMVNFVRRKLNDPRRINMLNFHVWDELDAETMRIMFWATAIPNHPEYLIPQPDGSDAGLDIICSYLDFHSSAKLLDALLEAFYLYLGKESGNKAREARNKLIAGEKVPIPNEPTPVETTSTGNDLPQSPVMTSASA